MAIGFQFNVKVKIGKCRLYLGFRWLDDLLKGIPSREVDLKQVDEIKDEAGSEVIKMDYTF